MPGDKARNEVLVSIDLVAAECRNPREPREDVASDPRPDVGKTDHSDAARLEFGVEKHLAAPLFKAIAALLQLSQRRSQRLLVLGVPQVRLDG